MFPYVKVCLSQSTEIQIQFNALIYMICMIDNKMTS